MCDCAIWVGDNLGVVRTQQNAQVSIQTIQLLPGEQRRKEEFILQQTQHTLKGHRRVG